MVIFVYLKWGDEHHGFAFDDETDKTWENGSEPICLPRFGTVSSYPDYGIPSVRVIDVKDRELSVPLQEFVIDMTREGWRWIASDRIHPGLWVPMVDSSGQIVRKFDLMYPHTRPPS